ncbi:cyclase family protein [Peijinzhouia sedimentorum]
MAVIDLTLSITDKIPVFPGDKRPTIEPAATIANQGWNALRYSFGTHFATHIDAPFHMLENGKKLTDFPPETFIGEAIVIDVRGQSSIAHDLEEVREGDFVFFHTDHIKNISGDYFVGNPVISPATAQLLVDKKVRIVGLDSFTPDGAPYNEHKLFFRNDILIVENLVGLETLPTQRFSVIIAPLKIDQADGAPCRVFALIP